MVALRKIITEFIFDGDFKKVEKLEKSISKVKKTFEGLNPVVKDSLKVLGAIGALNIAKKLIVGANAFAKLAEDAFETESKFNVVFSSISGQAKQFSENLVKNYGLARNESKLLLGDTGDLLTGFGFSQEEALKTSNAVQELAVDLASFTNIQGGSTRASKAITKALIGEKESLKLLGIAILDADIKREASLRGITKELTRQQKAQITLDLILRQSKNALGDFARTSDSASNRSKLLRKRLEDLKIAVGKLLLPIRQFVVFGLTKLVEGIIIVLPWIKILILGLTGLIAILGVLKAQMIITAGVMAVQWAIAFAPLIGTIALITSIAVAIGLLIDDIIAFFQGRNSVTAIIVEEMKNLGSVLIKDFTQIGKEIWDILSFPFKQLFKLIEKTEDFLTNLSFGKLKDLTIDFFGKNIAPTKSNNSNTSNTNNNNAVVQSPKIIVNVDNKGSGGQTLIKDITKGIQNGLQNSLNQSLRTMAN